MKKRSGAEYPAERRELGICRGAVLFVDRREVVRCRQQPVGPNQSFELHPKGSKRDEMHEREPAQKDPRGEAESVSPRIGRDQLDACTHIGAGSVFTVRIYNLRW